MSDGEVAKSEDQNRPTLAMGGWLRRAMPRVAIAAVALTALQWLLKDILIHQNQPIKVLLGLLTFLAVFLTIIYYGFKSLRWVMRHLLWRVRRRLATTYIFVGLTPIVLLALYGLVAAFGGSSQAMARIIETQLSATEKQTMSSARSLALALSNLQTNTSTGSIQSWLDERVALLQASLPGARIAAWRYSIGADGSALEHRESAQFVSVLEDENTRGVGSDTTPIGAPLPEWLRNHVEWSGLAYFPASPNSAEAFGSPSIRALARSHGRDKTFALLLIVPVSQALVRHYRESTGIYLRPLFVGKDTIDPDKKSRDSNVVVGRQNERGSETAGSDEVVVNAGGQKVSLKKDQFGEMLKAFPYPVTLPATSWLSGETAQHIAFIFDWSWTEALIQILGGGKIGQVWRYGLYYIAVALLILELLALISAIWMTRAVTGTVHELYVATQHIENGDFSYRARAHSRDQLGELAEAFNEMAARVESSLEERARRERLEREIEIAAEVQAKLFPEEVPRLVTASITGECRAARSVAGDYYDFVEIAAGLVVIALGDVSGKGIGASLVMSNLRAALRAQAAMMAERLRIAVRTAAAATGGSAERLISDQYTKVSVSEMMSDINQQLCRSTEENRFATLFLALYEDHTGMLHYSNAGHNEAILIHADGMVERLRAGGLMLGMFDWESFGEEYTALAKGDLLVIFSDGISEAQNSAGEEYGEERLAQFALTHRALPGDELRRAIFDEIDRWTDGQERGDDQTIVIMKPFD